MPPKVNRKKVMPIPINAKKCEKYASELSQDEMLEAIRSISERGLKWVSVPKKARLGSQERRALEAALVQHIEDLDQGGLVYVLHWLSKTGVVFAGLDRHIKTGTFFALQQHLLDFSKNELIDLIASLGRLRFDWKDVIPIQQIRFAQKIDDQIPNMEPNELATILTGLSQMGFKWKLLRVCYGDEIVDLREVIVDQIIARYDNFCLSDKLIILESFSKLEYVKGRSLDKTDDLCIALLINCIRECDSNQAQQICLLHKNLVFGIPDQQIKFAQKLREQILNMDENELVSIITRLSHINFKWKQLRASYGEEQVDLREALFSQIVARYNDFNLRDKLTILSAFAKMEYVKGR